MIGEYEHLFQEGQIRVWLSDDGRVEVFLDVVEGERATVIVWDTLRDKEVQAYHSDPEEAEVFGNIITAIGYAQAYHLKW